jgi:hypothetical protein
VVQKFKQNSMATWEAQQECSRPETELNYLRGFSEERHGVRNYDAEPENGPVYMAVDWGGTNPHAVNWYQHLEQDIEALDYNGNIIRLIEGTLVCFDEIYVAEIGVKELARQVKLKEQVWRQRHRGWEVRARFADPQGKMARLDFKDEGLRTVWNTTRDFDTQVEWLVRDYYEPGLVKVDVNRCPMFVLEPRQAARPVQPLHVRVPLRGVEYPRPVA